MLTFAQWLRAIRKKRKLTQDDVAAELGISFATVSRWESGAEPRPAQLKKIAAWGKITATKLLALFGG